MQSQPRRIDAYAFSAHASTSIGSSRVPDCVGTSIGTKSSSELVLRSRFGFFSTRSSDKATARRFPAARADIPGGGGGVRAPEGPATVSACPGGGRAGEESCEDATVEDGVYDDCDDEGSMVGERGRDEDPHDCCEEDG